MCLGSQLKTINLTNATAYIYLLGHQYLVDNKKYVSKETKMPKVSLSDAKKALDLVETVASHLAGLANRTVELAIANETKNVYLEKIHDITGSNGGDEGSGYWDKGERPALIIEPGMGDVSGLESNGAGAITMLTYRLTTKVYKDSKEISPYYLMVYAGSPLSTSDRVHTRLYYLPQVKNFTDKDMNKYFHSIFDQMDTNDHVSSQHVEAFGIRVDTVMSGKSDILAEFFINDSDLETNFIKNRHNNKYLGSDILTSADSNAYRSNDLIYSTAKSHFHAIPFQLPSNMKKGSIALAGMPSRNALYLNFRNLTGAVKLHGDHTSWEIKTNDNSESIKLYSSQEKQYMWLD